MKLSLGRKELFCRFSKQINNLLAVHVYSTHYTFPFTSIQGQGYSTEDSNNMYLEDSL